MMNTGVMIFLSCGGLAGLAFLFTKFMGKGKKSDIMSAVHKVNQKNTLNEINEINKKQNVVKVEIKKGEKVAEETKTRIKKIQNKAAEDIKEVLSEDKAVADTLNDFNDGMEDW